MSVSDDTFPPEIPLVVSNRPSHTSISPTAAPIALRCEGLANPIGLDEPHPHFRWQHSGSRRGLRQTAYQLQVASATAGFERPNLWDTGKIDSSDSLDIVYHGRRLQPRSQYSWRVRTWDDAGQESPWSEIAEFETGLLGEAWRATWVGLPRKVANDSPPAIYFRREFNAFAEISSARLAITARGLFVAHINGSRVGRDVLVPGWTDYRKRIDYLYYDVTSLTRSGKNLIEVTLGDGWWSGLLSEPQFQLRYGTDPAFLAQLVITDADGNEEIIGTDSEWQARADGPIRENSLYHGETFDARRDLDRKRWKPAVELLFPDVDLWAKHCPAVRCMETRHPVAITEPTAGAYIFDLGENIVGWARLCVTALAGTEIQLRFGEMLEADGTLYTANLRSAKATDRYICSGGGNDETWEPSFTFHGFRYVEVTGLPTAPNGQTITGIVIHSALDETGTFECSDPLINRLQKCIVRGQKGNFVDLPTDCPQRDERLGWSGDAQVFAPTACYNLDSAPLFRSWMRAMCDGQRVDGAFPDLAPHILLEHGNAGWGDAGIIVPWTVWRFTGDTAILQENYRAMARSIDFQRRTTRNLIRPDTLFGDWLAPDAARPEHTPTPKDLIGTAYFAHTTRLLAQIAQALGKERDAQSYTKLADNIREAFQREFVTATGRVLGDTQTSYLLALGFDLLENQQRPAAIERLVELISSRGWHLTTGFLGTPLLCPVLTACGCTDVAYRLLQRTTYPSWLYPILNGATTMWERWDSWTKERGFGDVGMNSFNHYAYGAVGEWLYSTIAGIAPLEPGFRRIRIAPVPGGGLTSARATYETPFGRIESSWKISQGIFTLEVTVPPNTEAEIHLPAKRGDSVSESRKPLIRGAGIRSIRRGAEGIVATALSGSYQFRCHAPRPLSP